MGNWNITVRGVGIHHNNGRKDDANVMTADFVRALKAAGHSVVSASFTYGGEDDLTKVEPAPPATTPSTKPESD
jgi:hypothetical protein